MIERLTNRNESGIAYTKIPANPSNMIDVGECYTGRIIDRLAAYEDTGLTPEEVQKIAKAKSEGRLVVLPLKVGSTIYRLEAPQYSWEIVSATIYLDETIFTDDSDNIIKETDIGKTVFLTREEAEKALEGSE